MLCRCQGEFRLSLLIPGSINGAIPSVIVRGTRIILIVEGIFLVGILGSVEDEVQAAEGQALIGVARVFLHMQRYRHLDFFHRFAVLRLFISRQQHAAGDPVRVGHQGGQGTGVPPIIISGQISKRSCGWNSVALVHIHVDYVRQLLTGRGSSRPRSHSVQTELESQIAFVHHFEGFHYRVAGFPFVIVENLMVRIFFNGNISAILSAADMDQIDLQISRYDLVARTGDRIGEPRKCGTDEHCTAQHYGQNAGKQCSFGVFAACHCCSSSLIHF